MATSTYDYFFKLPGELREQILTSLLVKPEGVRIHDLSCSDLMRSKRPEPQTKPRLWHDEVLRRTYVVGEDFALWPLSYFLVSRAFHREASAAYFSRNMFYLYGRKRYRPPPRRHQRPTAEAPGPGPGPGGRARTGGAQPLQLPQIPQARPPRRAAGPEHGGRVRPAAAGDGARGRVEAPRCHAVGHGGGKKRPGMG